MTARLQVAIVWHMHQPYYRNPATGLYAMPWVRLHALKDYYGMVAMLREIPEVRVNFNLVPSLLLQIEDYASGRARERHLELAMKDASCLEPEERLFILRHFFQANPDHLIRPFRRYRELWERRGLAGDPESLSRVAGRFDARDYRDLQLWSQLAWFDPEILENDEALAALVRKERDFSEEDKRLLQEKQRELLSRIIPAYREAAAAGQIEISTSPFYHPILPLLCDSDIYLVAQPNGKRLLRPFRHPEDARLQIERAIDYHRRLFGEKPRGLWPSEGSVSEEVAGLAAELGFLWMASDEEILARSLEDGRGLARDAAGRPSQPAVLCQPYVFGPVGRRISLVFRDHVLSDLIGFSYTRMEERTAAEDLLSRLRGIAGSLPDGSEPLLCLILDGENAWEYYPEGGRTFLRHLYRGLVSDPVLQSTTVSRYLETHGDRKCLPRLFPGSWINHDFYIWIGHQDDRRAWGQIQQARDALMAYRAREGAESGPAAAALEELLIAEGSDWFWWYGEDHSSENDADFDLLFREHLKAVYRHLGLDHPADLDESNISTGKEVPIELVAPTRFIYPQVDGKATSYFEWLAAGSYDPSSRGVAMHAGPRKVATVRFGFNLESLFLLIETEARAEDLLREGVNLSVRFKCEAPLELRVESGKPPGTLWRKRKEGGWDLVPSQARAAAADAFELSMPFAELGLAAGQSCLFAVALWQQRVPIERHPEQGYIAVVVPGEDFELRNWQV